MVNQRYDRYRLSVEAGKRPFEGDLPGRLL
jgi:hypothetical protein